MAKTVDELVLKTSVEGAQSLDQVNAKLASIDESAKKTAQAMNQVRGGVQNVAYQIQDLAVQISMGTSVFMALGQQLPQLLSGFGTVGVVIGAVAAVAIPALQAGLKAAGIDMRNLKEMTDDLSKANEAYLNAQKQNQTTLAGLGNSYGALTGEAKIFFDLQQKLTQQKAQRETIDLVNELKDAYKGVSREAVAATRDAARFTPGAGVASAEIGIWFRQFRKGVTEEQGFAVADMLKKIDAASPEKTVKAINDILRYLSAIGPEGEKFKQVFEKTVEPMLKINQELIDTQKNLKDAAEQATIFNTKLLGIQTSYIGRIGDAKRSFDVVYSYQLEQEQKIAEVRAQFAEKNKDGINRSKEQAAAENKIRAETTDKVKDFAKAQQETFYGQMLNNEAKQRQLTLQRDINILQIGQIDTLSYQSILEEANLKNILDQQNALLNFEEQLRKNQITEERAKVLREQAAEIRAASDKLALQNVDKIRLENERSIRIQVQGLETQNNEKIKALNLEETMFGYSTNRQTAARKELELENARNRELINIANNSKLSDSERITAKAKLNEQYDYGLKVIQQEFEYRQKMDANMKAGAQDRLKQINESFTPFKVGGMMIDSVFGNMNSAIDKFVETGKFKFSDFATSVVQDLLKIQMKAAATSLLSQGLGFLGITLPGKAAGGFVGADQAYMVGEQGPELFIPSSAGNIVPNNALRGSAGATNVTYNINAIDAKSVAQLFAENRMTLFGTVEQARRELPMRTR